jgi:hypothetical protein
MSIEIGFVILSHNNPHQLRRLVRCLQRIYDDPPISIHHDFGQSSLSQLDFPPDVQFVAPHLKTRWGKFSLVDAALRALKLLYQKTTPDWFFLLSAADYPTMPARIVRNELASTGADALLDCREVPTLSDPRHKITYRLSISKYHVSLTSARFDPPLSAPDNPSLKHFVLPRNVELAWRRYIAFKVWCPIIRSGPRIGRFTMYLPFEGWRLPFTPDFKCLYGDQWFAGNRRAAEILLNPTDKHMQLRRHLRSRNDVSDECYYQTILGNARGLKISNATRRFSDWTESAGGPQGGPHPKVLGFDDLPAIISSKAYFARKFAPTSPALDEIDKMLL